MTIVAYRDGVMAADSASFLGTTRVLGFKKVARGPDGTLAGVAGQGARASQWLAWIEGGEKGEEPAPIEVDDGERSNFVALLVRPNGTIFMVEGGGRHRIEASYAALGGAMEAALGALFAGASAEVAVAAAIAHTNAAGGEIQTVTFEGA